MFSVTRVGYDASAPVAANVGKEHRGCARVYALSRLGIEVFFGYRWGGCHDVIVELRV